MKVFVCATYSDLAEERKSVLEAITRLQHQYDSMEFFGARTNRPIETCLQEVRESDLLVVILGHLYGTIVAGTDLSFTETEYNEGYRLGKPCLIYTRDPKAPILIEHVESDPDKSARLKAFKATLHQRYTVAPFSGPNDLALKVAADIPRAISSKPSAQTPEARLALLKSGNTAWNEWRRANPDIIPDLTGADLQGIDLRKVDLRNAKLVSTNLNNANLTGADLSGAVLFKTTLRGAVLDGVRFDQTLLIGVELGEATLANSSFSGTIVADVDLHQSRSLDTVRHYGTSTLGVDTLIRSRGRLPEAFLRGVGMPDQLISYLPSFFGTAIEFYSCFLAYAHADYAFAERLHADLQANGVRCWFAEEDLESGRRLSVQVDEAIRVYDRLILVLSEQSLASKWVRYEVQKAVQQERRSGRQLLLPVRLVSFDKIRDWRAVDAESGVDFAREVREYFIADFSNWKDHASYQAAFQRLMRDLRSERTQDTGLERASPDWSSDKS